ncbi:MAG: AI-2E family transporter [archaeon]
MGLFLACFFILKPFIIPILSGMVLAFAFYPLYDKLHKKSGHPRLAALAISVGLVLVIAIIGVFLINSLWHEAYGLYLSGKVQTSMVSDLVDECTDDTLMCTIINKGMAILSGSESGGVIEEGLKRVTSTIAEFSSDFILSLPHRAIELFLIMFLMYYLLIEGPNLMQHLWRIAAVKKKQVEILKNKISDVVYAVLYGTLMTALIQGFIAGVGYWIFGVRSPIFWGMITAFAALLPFIGTGLIWIPIAITKTLGGMLANNTSEIWMGIGLAIYGALLVSTIDNLIKPYIIGGKGKVHPALVLLGVLGGLAMFGMLGLILGPLIVVLTAEVLKLYLFSGHSDKKKSKSD